MANYFKTTKIQTTVVLVLLCTLVSSAMAAEGMLDFSNCVIVTDKNPGKLEQKAVSVLQEEIQKRTGIKPKAGAYKPAANTPAIIVGLQSNATAKDAKKAAIAGAEGFYIKAKKKRQQVVIAGKDPRGVFYGVGHLLRKMELRENSILVPSGLKKLTAPKYGLRGHQLGFRPKTNAYDGWSPAQYDQYIRELGLFGTNSIEIIPPISDDDRLSSHMKNPDGTLMKDYDDILNMMAIHSDIIDSYDMDVWIWYPNVGKDYKTEKGIVKELAEREGCFKKLTRIDHILVPGGDPGHLHPDEFFPLMDRMAVILKKYHPNAKIWVSPQAMKPTREWLATFYKYINKNPDWLGGCCFAPWIKTPLPEMRRVVDNNIKIRRYPDITHNVACQYPVRNWDLALALTTHRECYNPRPLAMKTIHNALDEYASGSLTYSEGINDDINKFIWGDQDWDTTTEAIDTLRDYARLFISPDFADELAHGFMAQEKNWVGPLASNDQVNVTFQQWRQMEKTGGEKVNENYRFQMGLIRAYYDMYIKRRLIRETNLESHAMDILSDAAQTGSVEAMKQAEEILNKAKTKPIAQHLKKKCEALADSLHEKIKAQLYVKKHDVPFRTRGAFMDGIDEPLNDIAWLTAQFKEIRKLDSEPAKLAAIDKVVNRTNPGPGGFYDNMGSSLRSPRIGFYYKVDREEDRDIPMAWKNQAGTIYETPLELVYDNLDPDATYTARIAYRGRRSRMMQLVANDKYKIHDPVRTMNPPIREFQIPKEATASGKLKLTWTCGEGQRGSQICEIWL
ncbi:MAG: glycoside hydrolase family 20 zincin-like fold domain-containing protein, partial [Planctomycetota bacterium]